MEAGTLETVNVRPHSPLTYKSVVPMLSTVLVGAFILYLTFVDSSELRTYAALLTNAFMLLLLVTFFGRFEETSVSSKEVALIGNPGASGLSPSSPPTPWRNIEPRPPMKNRSKIGTPSEPELAMIPALPPTLRICLPFRK